jgi:hypothetical protein
MRLVELTFGINPMKNSCCTCLIKLYGKNLKTFVKLIWGDGDGTKTGLRALCVVMKLKCLFIYARIRIHFGMYS